MNFKAIIYFFFCQILFFSVTSSAFGENSSFFWEKCKREFETGAFDAAYEDLFLAFKEDSGALEVNFYLGRAAFESGRYEEAVMTFERMLILDPDSNRVKLELGRSYMELGSNEMAKRYFKEVLASVPPPLVEKNINLLLQSMRGAEKRNFWSGFVSFGVDSDDNVNVAPNENVVNIDFLGTVIPVAIDQNAEEDQIYVTYAELSHSYKIQDGPLSWRTTFTNYNALYDRHNVHDLSYVGVNTGVVIPGKRHVFDIYGLFNHIELDYDRYVESLGVSFKCTAMVTDVLTLTVGFTGQKKNNFQDEGQDAYNYQFIGGSTFIYGLNRFTVGLTQEIEQAEAGVNDFKMWLASVRYDRQLPFDVGVFSSGQYKESRYGEKELLFNVKRKDEIFSYSVGLAKTIWVSASSREVFSGQLRYTITEADSSIGLYEYDKSVSSVTLTMAF